MRSWPGIFFALNRIPSRKNVEIDEAALEKLSALAQAKEDANRLKQSELNILRRREQIALDDIDQTTKLRYEVKRFIIELKKLADEIVASSLGQKLVLLEVRQLKSEMEQLQSNMVLLLTERNPVKITQAIDELDNILTIKKQLKQRRKNLAQLEEQAAKYGSLDVPLKLQNSIEAEQEKIVELEEKLAN